MIDLKKRVIQLIEHTSFYDLMLSDRPNRSLCIALIDGLVAKKHPCFDSSFIQLVNLYKTSNAIPMNHATSVASILMGIDSKILGLCRNSHRLLSIEAIDDDVINNRINNSSLDSRLARSIMTALYYEASVIQMSLEFVSHAHFPQTAAAIKCAAIQGIRTVISSGNSAMIGQNPLLSTPGVVPVANADNNDMPYPNTGLGLSVGARGLLAPGIDIPVASLPDTYVLKSGTSYSASFVTAAFILLYSHYNKLSKNQIWDALLYNNYHQRKRISVSPQFLNIPMAMRYLDPIL